jgi:hypothetical protein
MPIYGKAKVRTMARSILPSTKRKLAKGIKDDLHRSNRRSSSMSVGLLRGPASYVEDLYEDSGTDFKHWIEFKDLGFGDWLYDRRNGDKLSHFEVWAYHKTKHLRPEDRFSKIRGVLPEGVIGMHAASHLSFLDYREYDRWRWYYRNRTREEEMRPSQLERSQKCYKD